MQTSRECETPSDWVRERKNLEKALLEAADRERRRIAREMHENLGQHLLGSAFAAKGLANSLPEDSPAAADAHRLADLIQDAVKEARSIVRVLVPSAEDGSDPCPALRELVARARDGATCRFEGRNSVHLANAEAAAHVFRVAQEALENARLHSNAREIVLSFEEDKYNLVLNVSDDGTGFDYESSVGKGSGLQIMKCHARALNGWLSFDTPKSGGTSVTLAIPKPK